MKSIYIKSSDLAEYLCTSKRSLNRWQKRRINPLPMPAIRSPEGGSNLFLIADIKAWEEREWARTKRAEQRLNEVRH